MSDPSTTALEDRLGAVVSRIQQAILAAPRFRPSDPALASEYDTLVSSLLQSLVEISAAAAVDKASIQVATDLAAQRRQFSLDRQKLQNDADAASCAVSAQINSAILPLLRGGA